MIRDSKVPADTKPVPLLCNHCDRPPCADACPVGATYKRADGIVVCDPGRCIGCRECMVACPYNARHFNFKPNRQSFNPNIARRAVGVAESCNFCAERLAQGGIPACVEICPREALTFGTRKDLIKIARQQIQNYPDRYVDHIYGEHEMGGCNWLYISDMRFADIGMREDLGIIAARQLTSGPLALAPMVVGLGPVLLTGIYAISKRKDRIANAEKLAAVKRIQEDSQVKIDQQIIRFKEKFKKEKEAAVKREVKKAVEEALKQAGKHSQIRPASQSPANTLPEKQETPK